MVNSPVSPSQYSISPSSIGGVDKAIIPVDKIEHAGSMSHEHSSSEGAPIPHHEAEELTWGDYLRESWSDFWSEFFGTCVMILFGDGVVAQVSLSDQKKGDYQSISWGWGLAVMLGVYCSKKSGGHLNPAVTFCNCLYRGHPWRKWPVYALGQLLGAMAGAFIVFGTYQEAIDNFEGPGIRTVGGATSTAGIFCTYPAAFLTRTQMWWSEFVSSSILMFVIFAMADPGNGNAQNLMPLGLFFLIFGIGACFGWQTGYAINLARDFGPRLVSYIVGYGHDVWSAGGYYFWIPMVAPFFGTAFGAFLYDLFIFEGDSPIKGRWLGLTRLAQPKRSVWSNTYKARQSSKV